MKIKTIPIFIIFFMSYFECEAQLQSTLNNNGIAFPVANISNTSDTTGLSNPKIGQRVFNSNSTISGRGAEGSGFYVWQSNIWKKIASTMPSGTVVLSETQQNIYLEQKGFSFISKIQITETPISHYYLFIKK